MRVITLNYYVKRALENQGINKERNSILKQMVWLHVANFDFYIFLINSTWHTNIHLQSLLKKYFRLEMITKKGDLRRRRRDKQFSNKK